MWLSRVALRTHCASATAIQFTLRTHVRTCALCTAQVHATASSSMTSPTPAAALFAQVKGLVPDLEGKRAAQSKLPIALYNCSSIERNAPTPPACLPCSTLKPFVFAPPPLPHCS